jgi:hypothetical protein
MKQSETAACFTLNFPLFFFLSFLAVISKFNAVLCLSIIQEEGLLYYFPYSLFLNMWITLYVKDCTRTRHLIILTLTNFIDYQYGRVSECEDSVLLLFPKKKALGGEWWWENQWESHQIFHSVNHVLFLCALLPEMWLFEVESCTKSGYTTAVALLLLLLLLLLLFVCLFVYLFILLC